MIKKVSLYTLLVLGLGYLLVLQIKAIWPFTIDDMYISLRYAKHWVEGYGLLWNIAEEPVEGYSNFSFVVIAALALKLSIDPIIALKSAGVFGLLLSTISLYFLSRFWFTPWIACIPCAWLLLYKGEILWSVSGLETTVYQALICSSLVMLFRGMGYQLFPKKRSQSNAFYGILAGIVLALAGMTRPEAPALMLTFYGLALVDKPEKGVRHYYYGLLWSGLSLVLLFLPYFFWRWQYYGHLFPNAVYCKGFREFSFSLILQYIELVWPFLLIALPALLKTNDKRHYFLWVPSLVYSGLLWGADPIVAFANRLFLPVFILLLPLTLQGMRYSILYFIPKNDTFCSVYLTIAALLFAFLFIPKMTLASYRYFAINPQAGIRLRQEVVAWLDKYIQRGSRVVLADSGLIPYASSLNFIDSYCLNNKKMTEISTENRYLWLCDEVIKSKPEVIILTSLKINGKIIYTPADRCLKQALEANKWYKSSAYFKSDSQNSSYRYEIYTLLN
ncbi:hypothetical protein [Legionella jamestowniensis]|uniref:LphB n=1 Tax=Legionella jamestowniensis TaxID=455 RepID=A0A0W0UTL9_9GAMM|nr:hypothetical protein [Legionella jamestowniensis]KTD11219.1 LphB [Legionella jamestowniensis]OCH98079.1 protein LphB [Legionella jamestowniensis]SFL70409.1 hypothetical protein SAMN02746073_1502 [Legionella jamestowniensis DSM 19215]